MSQHKTLILVLTLRIILEFLRKKWQWFIKEFESYSIESAIWILHCDGWTVKLVSSKFHSFYHECWIAVSYIKRLCSGAQNILRMHACTFKHCRCMQSLRISITKRNQWSEYLSRNRYGLVLARKTKIFVLFRLLSVHKTDY